MPTPGVIPPPGFQLEQDGSPAIKAPAGFELETTYPSDQGGTTPQSGQQALSQKDQVRPPAGFELEHSGSAVHAQQPGRPPQSHHVIESATAFRTPVGNRVATNAQIGLEPSMSSESPSPVRQQLGTPTPTPSAGRDLKNPGQRLPLPGMDQQNQSDVLTGGGISLFGDKLHGSFGSTSRDYSHSNDGDKDLAIRIPRGRRAAQTAPLEAAQTMLRYEQRVGNLPKPNPQLPPKQAEPEHLTPQLVQQFTDKVTSLPELQRGDAMVHAHQLMAAWMLDRIGKPFLGPDHKLHIIKNPAEAEKIALEFINDQVDFRDKRLAQSTESQQPLVTVKQQRRPRQAGAAHPSQPAAYPALAPAEQARIAANNARVRQQIANYPENIPPPDPEYVRRKQIYMSLPPEPELPEFEEDPEQERRIWAQDVRDASKSMVPNAAVPVLDVLNRYAVQPFEKASQWGAGKGRSLARSLAADIGSGAAMPDLPNEPEVTDEMRAAYEQQQEEKRRGFIQEHPRVMGVADAIGSTAGGIAADPRNWPFFFSGAARPLLQKSISAGFTGLMAKGAMDSAGRVQQVWDDPNIPLEQKYEAITNSVLQAILAGGAAAHVTDAARVPPLDSKLTEQLNHLPEAARQEIFNRLQNKLNPPLSPKDQVTAPFPRTIQRPSSVRRGSPSGQPPPMGRNMTADSPAVRRVQSQAQPVPGQAPEVKVKQEDPQVQAALAQPPAAVSSEEVSQIGRVDAQTGRQVLQPSNSLVQNERLAGESAPYLTTQLSEVAASVPGARFDRLRPQKGLQRLEEKVADGKPPSTIGDNLAAQIVAGTVAAKDQLIARLRQQFPVISVDDKFLEPREKAGYPSTNLQLQMPNGGTAEVQIVTPEIQAITDQTHRLYTRGRNFPENSADRGWYWNQAAAMHRQALEKFLARNVESPASPLAPGQKVVLRNGQTGKVVGPSRDVRRVVVRTGNGLRTVKPGDLTFARPRRTGPPQQPPLQLGFRDARRMQWSLVEPGRNLPAYLALDEMANRILNHVSGGERSGMNAPAFYAQQWVERIGRLAEQQRNSFARQKLANFARAIASAIHPERGLNIAEKTADLPEHVDTISEELFHSLTRGAVPVEELVDHQHFQTMRPRLERQTGSKNDLILVAEAMNDVAMGESPELTLGDAGEFARDMWQAIAKYSGLEVLRHIQDMYKYLNDLMSDMGVTLSEERQSYVQRAQSALDEIINRSGNSENFPRIDVRSSGRKR